MADAEELLKKWSKDDTFPTLERSPSAYNPMYSFVLLKGEHKHYMQQYADMYFLRLAKLKPAVEAVASDAWEDFEIAGEHAQRVERVLDVRQGQLCWVAGTIYMDLPLKPNILEDISKEHWLAGPPPRQTYTSPTRDAQVMLEDESGRLRLTGAMLKTNLLVTGVIVAVLGTENADGEFEVLDLHVGDLPRQPQRWERDESQTALQGKMDVDHDTTAKKIVLISGLSISGTEADTLNLSLLSEYLLGEALGTEDQVGVTKFCRVIIAGNSISSDVITAPPPDPMDTGTKKATQKKYGYDSSAYNPTPTAHLDQFLSELLPSIPITIMPGEHDPANASLPQQGIHQVMFPHSRAYGSQHRSSEEGLEPGWFDSVTNPWDGDVEGWRLMGNSGQPVDDIFKYIDLGGLDGTGADGRLEVMESILRWRCGAPTAPDTLWSYPFQENDQFVIEECPHVYFVGNQPRFDTTIIEGPAGQQVRLVAIPKFHETGQIVLLDTESLEVELVKIDVHDEMDNDNSKTKSLMEGTLPEKRFTALMVLGPPVQDENIKYFRARLYSTMLINEHVAISTPKLLLVPYSKHHVPRYHEWMQDPIIQDATASEPLTLAQEYAMQESWRKDADKLTFIICHPVPHLDPIQQAPITCIHSKTYDKSDQMIGDVNLFLSTYNHSSLDAEPHSDNNKAKNSPLATPPTPNQTQPPSLTLTGELELMIPTPGHQRKGHGRAALLTFIRYILTHESQIISEYMSSHPLPSTSTTSTDHPTTEPMLDLTAKISSANTASLSLFQSLGFEKIRSNPDADENEGEEPRPNYFGEWEVRLPRAMALKIRDGFVGEGYREVRFEGTVMG